MAKKRRKRGKRRRTSNPTSGRVRAAAKRVSKRISRSIAGLDVRHVLTHLPYYQAGMLAAKWAVRRFGEGGLETDPGTWNWSHYAKGILGGFGAALLANQIRKGAGTKVLEGAVNLIVYKAIQNELIAGSTWATGQFGQEYEPTEYMVAGNDELPLAYDATGNLFPADDRHRLPEMGSVLEPVGRLGSVLEPVGRLGQVDPYARAFQD